jgi:hypothetical protein
MEDIYLALHHEIPREELMAELKQFWQSTRMDIHKEEPKPKSAIVDPVQLFHPKKDVQHFRTLIQGRAWFPPEFFSILFIVWHQTNDFPWTILPHTLANHKKTKILELLKSTPPPVTAHVWNLLLKDLSSTPLPGAVVFTERVLGKVHPSANAMYLTRGLPNWQECWTRNSWPMRRSLTRKLKQWRTPPKTSDLITMVQALYAS